VARCGLEEVIGPLPLGKKPSCQSCQNIPATCSWTHHIPSEFYHLKYAIINGKSIPEGAADPTGPDTPPPDTVEETPELDLSERNLARLLQVTETAIAEVDTRAREIMSEERLKICEGLKEVYND